MKHRIVVCLIVACILLFSLFVFYTSTINSKGECFINSESTSSSTIPDVETTTESITSTKEIHQWNWTSSGDGENTATVTGVTIVDSTEGLSEKGFMKDAYVCVYNGNFAERKGYTYPEFINEDGQFAPDVRMIVVDIVVENPSGATNRWKNDSGEYENHYSDPYIFNVSSVCSLIYLKQAKTYDGITQCTTSGCSYFSLRESTPENELCFKLEPNETISLQVGFLIGNNSDGSDIDLKDLGIGLSGSLNDPWFSLELGDE